jgi:hypothetical protein
MRPAARSSRGAGRAVHGRQCLVRRATARAECPESADHPRSLNPGGAPREVLIGPADHCRPRRLKAGVQSQTCDDHQHQGERWAASSGAASTKVTGSPPPSARAARGMSGRGGGDGRRDRDPVDHAGRLPAILASRTWARRCYCERAAITGGPPRRRADAKGSPLTAADQHCPVRTRGVLPRWSLETPAADARRLHGCLLSTKSLRTLPTDQTAQQTTG